MFSVEDPVLRGARCGVGAQVMGPGDSYLVQHSRETGRFWAEPHALRLGNTFRPCRGAAPPAGMLGEAEFGASVAEGFQSSAALHCGVLRADSATAGDGPASGVGACAWSFTVEPAAGWGGGRGAEQKSTASWLSSLPVFDPHWQVLASHGRATGWVDWGGRRYSFERAPFYAEKNWGGAFPLKWFWAQCNAFPSHPGLALTGAGGVRSLPSLPGGNATEEVALLGIHLPPSLSTSGDVEFIEFSPWTGRASWRVAPWGDWSLHASTPRYEASLSAVCDPTDGAVLRAPTASRGLAAACRDTFAGRVTLALWRVDPATRRRGDLVFSATCEQCALETGGGPWEREWVGTSTPKQPLAALAGLNVDVAAVAAALGRAKPRGL